MLDRQDDVPRQSSTFPISLVALALCLEVTNLARAQGMVRYGLFLQRDGRAGGMERKRDKERETHTETRDKDRETKRERTK